MNAFLVFIRLVLLLKIRISDVTISTNYRHHQHICIPNGKTPS